MNPGTSSLRQVLLGVFVAGQLGFLCAANGLDLLRESQAALPAAGKRVVERLAPGLPASKGHLWEVTDLAATNLRRWMQVTEQDQSWSLFAPSAFKDGWFPALLLSWEEESQAAPPVWPLCLLGADGSVQAVATWNLLQQHPASLQGKDLPRLAPALALFGGLPLPVARLADPAPPSPVVPPAIKTERFLSDNEPDDWQHYFRVGNYRVRRFESMMLANLKSIDGETPETTKTRWRDDLEKHFRNNGDIMLAYVHWRYAEYQCRHPEKGPARHVVLVERRYHINPPEEGGWEGPFEIPLARWQPELREDPHVSPLERYNPVTQQFENVWK